MSKIKIWFEQCVMVTAAILAGVVIEGLLYHFIWGEDLSSFRLDWYQMFSLVLTGFLCGIPTVILIQDEKSLKIPFWLRIVMHCIFMYLVVISIGKIFKWFSDGTGFMIVTVIFLVIYVFVWVATMWLHKKEDDKINKALDDIRDEE